MATEDEPGRQCPNQPPAEMGVRFGGKGAAPPASQPTPWSEQEIFEEWRSMRKIVNAYQGYSHDALAELDRQRRNYERLPARHRELLGHLPLKFRAWHECAVGNARVIDAMLGSFQPPHIFQELEQQRSRQTQAGARGSSVGGEASPLTPEVPGPDAAAAHGDDELAANGTHLRGPLGAVVAPADREKVRCVLRSFVRDWSEEGAQERAECYGPILAEIRGRLLGAAAAEGGAAPPPRVIVPGAGLGRLANEIARLGCECQGNEFSYFMLIASNFLLNFVDHRDSFTLHPWIHSASNNLSDSDQMRAVRIPDISPREGFGDAVDPGGPPASFSMCAGDFVEVYGCHSQRAQWDCVATCFFIDTAHNIVEYIEVIHHVLRPGGLWVNLGPLLYHWADTAEDELSIELSLEDVLRAAEHVGFEVLQRKENVPCVYTANRASMLQTQYRCAFFTLRKGAGACA